MKPSLYLPLAAIVTLSLLPSYAVAENQAGKSCDCAPCQELAGCRPVTFRSKPPSLASRWKALFAKPDVCQTCNVPPCKCQPSPQFAGQPARLPQPTLASALPRPSGEPTLANEPREGGVTQTGSSMQLGFPLGIPLPNAATSGVSEPAPLPSGPASAITDRTTGDMSSTVTIPALIDCLSDENQEVRLAALAELDQQIVQNRALKTPELISALRVAATKDADPAIRSKAQQTLRKCAFEALDPPSPADAPSTAAVTEQTPVSSVNSCRCEKTRYSLFTRRPAVHCDSVPLAPPINLSYPINGNGYPASAGMQNPYMTAPGGDHDQPEQEQAPTTPRYPKTQSGELPPEPPPVPMKPSVPQPPLPPADPPQPKQIPKKPTPPPEDNSAQLNIQRYSLPNGFQPAQPTSWFFAPRKVSR